MKYSSFKEMFAKPFLFIAFCLIAFVSTANAGLDYYEIFVGKKLVMKRAVNQPLSLESLPVSQANINEQLVIHYYQCNAPNKLGTKRSVTLKDGNGKIIKEWKFADTNGSINGMVIPVKELLQLEKIADGGSLQIYYASQQLPAGKMLTSI